MKLKPLPPTFDSYVSRISWSIQRKAITETTNIRKQLFPKSTPISDWDWQDNRLNGLNQLIIQKILT